VKKWTPYISLDCEGQIWNILPGYNNRILLEVRIESSEIQFYDVDVESGKHRRLPQAQVPWWSQAVFYAPPYLLVQEFSEEQNPDIVQLHLYKSGSLIWTKEGQRFDGFEEDALILKNNQGEESSIKLEAYKDRTEFEFPWHYTEGEEYFSDVAKFLADTLSVHPVSAIDYYERDEAIVLAYYEKNANALKLSLLGLNDTGETLLNVVIEKNISGLADPTFLVSKRNVIFVKEKRHFFVYRIADF
jgi:hypothetical protein